MDARTPPTRMLRMPEVQDRTGFGRSKILEAAQSGEFPRPVKLGARSIAWYEHEVEAWLLARPRA